MAGAQSASPGSSALQRRTVTVLFASQLLSGAGLAAGVTVGALLAQEMLDSTALSGHIWWCHRAEPRHTDRQPGHRPSQGGR